MIRVDGKTAHGCLDISNGIVMARMTLYFEAGLTAGTAHVAEPHKHGAVEWFDIGDLPGNTVPYVRQALANILAGGAFSSFDDGGVL